MDSLLDFAETFSFWHFCIPLLEPTGKRIKPRLHPPYPRKQARVDQGRHRFAILVDNDTVVAILHLVEHPDFWGDYTCSG